MKSIISLIPVFVFAFLISFFIIGTLNIPIILNVVISSIVGILIILAFILTSNL